LRQIAGHKIIDVHRRHLGAQARNADLEISLDSGGRPLATSFCLAAQLLGQLTSPSQALIQAETRIALQDAINAMEPLDREILALRHFEELSNVEAAQELGIEPAAASKRFVRALQRLQRTLQDLGLVELSS
jgi:RNA polymerase sigma-70 factor (ECF subfamily)